MAQLGMTQREYDYWVDNMTEAVKLIGQDARLFQVDVENKDLYKDLYLKHRKSVDIGVIFEDDPKPVIKRMNWLLETEELPYVVYIVAKDRGMKPLEIRENMLIEVDSVYGLKTTRVFRVSNVKGTSIDPIMWICKLVPHRPKVDLAPEEPGNQTSLKRKDDTNFAYLNRDVKDRSFEKDVEPGEDPDLYISEGEG